MNREELRQLLMNDTGPAPKPVKVPELKGATFYVRMMTALEREELETAVFTSKKAGKRFSYRALVVAATVCDETGALLFTPAEAAKLDKANGNAVMRLTRAAETVNAMTEEDVDNAEKKSESVQPQNSSTG